MSDENKITPVDAALKCVASAFNYDDAIRVLSPLYFPFSKSSGYHLREANEKCLEVLADEVWRLREENAKLRDAEKPLAGHPDKNIGCLAFYKGEWISLVWNPYHNVWDDADGDDYFCDASDVTHYKHFPPAPESEERS